MPTATLTTTVPDAEIQKALDRAMRFATGKTKSFAQEAAIDGAVDAVTWAPKHHQPEHGRFENYAARLVKLFVSRALLRYRRDERNKPEVRPFGEEGVDPPAPSLPCTGSVPMTPELRDLRDAVRLYLIDGYTMEEAGLLMGMCCATFRERLKAAAVELNPGVREPDRKSNVKRLGRGRQRIRREKVCGAETTDTRTM